MQSYNKEVKGIWQKKAALPPHMDGFNGIRHVAPLRTPPKACFLRPTRVQNPNGISIGSAVLGDRFALCYRTVVLSCLSCLSVTLACCGQMVRWIKMKLGMEVGVGPRHIVLDGDPASPPQKRGTALPIIGPCIVAKQLHGSRCHLIRW